MPNGQPRYLWFFLGLFVVTCGLLFWSFVFEAQTHFLAGSPSVAVSAQPEPVPTQPPIRPTDPVRGSKDPKAIVIVEFADYTCLYCRLTEAELQSALSSNASDVRLVWRDLPIPSEHPEAVLSAAAGRCAAEQNHFWEMHDVLFTSPKLGLDDLKALARQIGLDTNAFNTCLDSGKYVAGIGSDVALAKTYGISGAPTFFFDGQPLSGLLKAADITSMIERERLRSR